MTINILCPRCGSTTNERTHKWVTWEILTVTCTRCKHQWNEDRPVPKG